MSPDTPAPAPGPTPAADELRFDRAERVESDASAGAAPDRPTVACARCKTAIESEYYHVNGKSLCGDCRERLAEVLAPPRGWGSWLRAAAYGLGAAIAGAAIYYAVIAIAGLEIGIVAILIGYMVGYAVQKATAGRGGRRFQVLAVVLTYWSVGLAYTPLAFGTIGDSKHTSASASSATAPSASPAADTAHAARTVPNDTGARRTSVASRENGSLLAALALLLVFAFALPVFAVVGSMPGGILSALIISFGLRQAWRMTAAPTLAVSGPYRVGSGPSPAGPSPAAA